jgi:hypothetical protein
MPVKADEALVGIEAGWRFVAVLSASTPLEDWRLPAGDAAPLQAVSAEMRIRIDRRSMRFIATFMIKDGGFYQAMMSPV